MISGPDGHDKLFDIEELWFQDKKVADDDFK